MRLARIHLAGRYNTELDRGWPDGQPFSVLFGGVVRFLQLSRRDVPDMSPMGGTRLAGKICGIAFVPLMWDNLYHNLGIRYLT